jgi:hypothetical protein
MVAYTARLPSWQSPIAERRGSMIPVKSQSNTTNDRKSLQSKNVEKIDDRPN